MLASGDPLWYGVGAVLARHFPTSEMTIVPHPGAFSLAASRLGWAIEDCIALSLHGRPIDSLRLHLAPRARLLLLSHDGDTPGLVAALLSASGWGESRMTVFEHLGGEREAVFSGTVGTWGERPRRRPQHDRARMRRRRPTRVRSRGSPACRTMRSSTTAS